MDNKCKCLEDDDRFKKEVDLMQVDQPQGRGKLKFLKFIYWEMKLFQFQGGNSHSFGTNVVSTPLLMLRLNWWFAISQRGVTTCLGRTPIGIQFYHLSLKQKNLYTFKCGLFKDPNLIRSRFIKALLARGAIQTPLLDTIDFHSSLLNKINIIS